LLAPTQQQQQQQQGTVAAVPTRAAARVLMCQALQSTNSSSSSSSRYQRSQLARSLVEVMPQSTAMQTRSALMQAAARRVMQQGQQLATLLLQLLHLMQMVLQ
jgi:hypothetical protein